MLSLSGKMLCGTLVLLMVALNPVTSRQDHCDTYCPTYSMEEALVRFRENLQTTYSGQEEAISVVRKALMDNMMSYMRGSVADSNDQPPLLFHFTGPTGVGKTLLTTVIKDALFVSDCGVKKIHLDIGYRHTDDAGRIQRIDNMKKTVVEQLESCPRSLVIFDDFQWAPVEMILALKEAFDENYQTLTWRDKTVRTNQALFIFCSDLESEQRHLTASMSMQEARTKVWELARTQWNMVDQGSAFGKMFVSQGLIPFVPLSESEMRKVIRLEMGKLAPRVHRHLSFHADNSSVHHRWLGEVRWNEKRLNPHMLEHLREELSEYNARAVRNLIERHLLVHSTDIARCLLSRSVSTWRAGWLWGGHLSLLDDINILDVDVALAFSVSIDRSRCIAKGMVIGASTVGTPPGSSPHSEL